VAEMLLGAALVIAGIGLGRFMPGRRRGPKPPKPHAPVCGCGHDLAHHEPDGAGGGTTCRALAKGKITSWDYYEHANGWEMVPCSCRQYTGPRILDPGYVARELSDGSR